MLFLGGCGEAKKNIKSCIELGLDKKVANKECNSYSDLTKKIRQITNEEINQKVNLLRSAEEINKNFERHTKNEMKFKAELTINLDKNRLNRLFSSNRVTNKPIFAHHIKLENDLNNSFNIIIVDKTFRINEEDYEFLTPTFSGTYKLRNDKTKNKQFTEFLNQCNKKPYCRFSVVGRIDAIKPETNDTSVGEYWVGWIDVEDFSFHKYIHKNPNIKDIEAHVLRKMMKRYDKGYKLDRGYIQQAIFEYVYES